MADFRRGLAGMDKASERAPSTFEAGYLPEAERERLCRELLSEFGVTAVKVTHTGEMIHSCPLPGGAHANADADASASLNYKKLTFNCLGCGSSGGLLWFIATCRGEDTDNVRAWLADQTGTGPDEQTLGSLLEFFDAVYSAPGREASQPIPKMSPAVLKPWRMIHPYLTDSREDGGRGIPEDTVIHFNVGYAANYKMRVGKEDDPGGIREIESPRIVIPHFWKGNLTGWQTRRLVDDGTPKYMSSPDFPKDTTIFNYDPKRRECVLVESPLSVLARWHHVPHMEAVFGAKMTDRQIRAVSMHPRVILWFDPDRAGNTATERAGEALQAYSDVWVVDSPWNADAADLDDNEVDYLLSESLVPYSLWAPRETLFCWSCKEQAHEGNCPQ